MNNEIRGVKMAQNNERDEACLPESFKDHIDVAVGNAVGDPVGKKTIEVPNRYEFEKICEAVNIEQLVFYVNTAKAVMQRKIKEL
jgi:hypothetical protein